MSALGFRQGATRPVDEAGRAARAQGSSGAYLSAPSWLGAGVRWKARTTIDRKVAAAARQAAHDMWWQDRGEEPPAWVDGRLAAMCRSLAGNDLDPVAIVKAARFATRWAKVWQDAHELIGGAVSHHIPYDGWTEGERACVTLKAIEFAAQGCSYQALAEELESAGLQHAGYLLHPDRVGVHWYEGGR